MREGFMPASAVQVVDTWNSTGLRGTRSQTVDQGYRQTLDETYKHAVSILIEPGIIQERRSVRRDEHQTKQLSLFSSRLRNSGRH